jgi:glycosyltransferase involved in cell wall biosynthesis
LADRVRFTGALPARQAFSLGRVFVMPSRAESFPYVLLEAAAAGLPLIATNVGGIPEVLPASDLVPARKPHVLAAAIAKKLAALDDALAAAANLRAALRERFAASSMCARVTSFYRTVMDR